MLCEVPANQAFGLLNKSEQAEADETETSVDEGTLAPTLECKKTWWHMGPFSFYGWVRS